jgi:uncharacterized protein DUF4419
MQTFDVSEVTPNTALLEAQALEAELEARTGRSVEAARSNLPLARLDRHMGKGLPHGFFEAVHTAFDRHYPLVLAPDDVWLCIAQGFGAHVNAHAEHLRERFVRHQGKEAIEIRRDEFVKGARDNDWPGCVADIRAAIGERIGKAADLIVSDFSTTGAVEKTASEVVLMSTVQQYFEFQVLSLCGIPRITLLGDENDWRSVRLRAAVFAEFELDWWLAALIPVLDQFVEAASGRVDQRFWTSFYKEEDESGGPFITGWINAFFPYLQHVGNPAAARNPFMHGRPPTGEWRSGSTSEELSSGLSSAPFVWKYLDEVFSMELIAGFVGVSQDRDTCAIRPAIGWAVR